VQVTVSMNGSGQCSLLLSCDASLFIKSVVVGCNCIFSTSGSDQVPLLPSHTGARVFIKHGDKWVLKKCGGGVQVSTGTGAVIPVICSCPCQ
jgi:hypothetical protein